jgi:hypothetical protein
VRHVCTFYQGISMPTDHTCPSAAAPDQAQRPDEYQPDKPDYASEWIQRAMAISREMYRNEDFRRQVTKRLF